MAAKLPASAELLELEAFLGRCEQAARPDDPMATTIFAVGSALEEVLRVEPGRHAPFQNPRILSGTREQRVSVLTEWLRQMPGFQRLSELPAVKRALKHFKLANKSKLPPAFSDDLAELRFWRLAALTVRHHVGDAGRKQQADQKDRDAAVNAAKMLLRIAAKTTLLEDALSPRVANPACAHLRTIQAYATSSAHKRRSDTTTAAFASLVTQHSFDVFGDSDPATVGALLALSAPNARQDSLYTYARKARSSLRAKRIAEGKK